MRDNARLLGILVALAVLSGCGGAARIPAASSSDAIALIPSAERCTASIVAVDVSAWRQVTADGFTFCVPAEWRGSGRTWRWSGARVTWGTGEPPRKRVVRTVVSAVPPTQLGGANAGPSGSDLWPEAIGGRDAQIRRNRSGSTYYTEARWESPRVWLTGETGKADVADLEVQIFRTVRFASR
jgi:hypothetical protein